MEQQDINRVSMVNAVISFADSNPAPTTGITAWGLALTGLKTKMVLVNGYNQIGKGKTSGVTTDTRILRSTMTELALKCANGTKGYANSINNNTLKALVDYTKTDLDGEAKEDVDDVCQEIYDATNANSAPVLNYGISAIDISDLQASIALYRTASQKPREAIVSKSQANAQSSKLVREAIDTYLIGQMDPIINTLKQSNNVHYLAYRQAREIINLGSTSAKLRGVCVREDNAFLANVTVTIYETGTNSIVKQVITDAKGKFNASKLPAGDFDFKWELEGYMTVSEINVHVAAGKEIQRKKVVMKKGGVTKTLTGDVAMGAIANIPLNGLHIIAETKMRLTVTGSTLRFYASASNTGAPGVQYFDVMAGQAMTKQITEWASVFGFDDDLEDFLNVQNVGAVSGHWDMRFENLGSE